MQVTETKCRESRLSEQVYEIQVMGNSVQQLKKQSRLGE